jgi:predicted nucleotidyltransferase
MKAPKEKPSPRLRVTDLNLRKAAQRLLGQSLVSTEMQYVQKVLGASATQQEIDENVLAVRRLPWTSIAQAD